MNDRYSVVIVVWVGVGCLVIVLSSPSLVLSLVLSYLVSILNRLVLPCLVLSCLVLSCLALAS